MLGFHNLLKVNDMGDISNDEYLISSAGNVHIDLVESDIFSMKRLVSVVLVLG